MPSPTPNPTPPPRAGAALPELAPWLALCVCIGLLQAAPALGMGPRPDELPRFEGDPQSTVFEGYSTARDGVLSSYTLVLQFAGCPDNAAFELGVDGELPVIMLPGVEQLDRDETCLRITGIERGEDTSTLRGRLGGCDRAGLMATVPVDCPEGCSPPEIGLTHDCSLAEVWIAGQPEIMASRTAPRNLGWLGGPRHTLAGFHFSALRPGPLQIAFDTDQDADLEVVAVHFVSDPEAEHTARVESLGARDNVYTAMVHTPGEYEMIVLLAGEEPLERVLGHVSPPTPLRPAPVSSDYAAACVPEGARTADDGFFSFAVDNCAGAWGRRNGLCPPGPNENTAGPPATETDK